VSRLRSDEVLARVADHLDYEYEMLMALAQAMASGISAQGWLTNALLESFVIHVRALVDFFYPPESAKSDDVIAGHFFDNPGEWERIRPQLSETLKRGRARAHKEIAHLTYARLDVTPEAKSRAFIDVANEMGALMQQFRNSARTRSP
jgi:hypothetical protein